MSDRSTRSAPVFRRAVDHAVTRVPHAAPTDPAGTVGALLAGGAFDCASHVVVGIGAAYHGAVPIERLLAAPADAPVGTLVDAAVPIAAPDEGQELAVLRAVACGGAVLAVVDGNGDFAGLVPAQKLLAVLQHEHEEDLARLGGFVDGTAKIRSASEEPVRRRFGHRIPWLLFGLGAALQSADFVSRFEHQLRTHLALAFFMPAIVYLADAVGTQTETVTVRALSIGIRVRTMVRSELLTGMSIGMVLALAAGVLVAGLWGQGDLAATVGLAVFATCGTATVTGMALPALLDALGIDPAFGSGPLATIVQDLVSVLIYFVVAAVVMA